MPSTNDNTAAAQELRLKRDRACDACRRRKTKCDGPAMSNHVCTNCIQTRKPCTYVEVSKPRGPPKAYITGLEDRLEALEALLQQIRPGQEFSEELGLPVVRGSWKIQDASNASSGSVRRKSPIANNVLPPLLIPYHSKNDDTGHVLLKTRPPRSTHLIFRSKPPSRRMRIIPDALSSSSEESSDETSSSSEEPAEETVISSLAGREKITLFVSENDNSTEDDNIRFHGRSSTAGLIEITRQFKHMHMKDTTGPPQEKEERSASPFPANLTVAQWRRPTFWRRPKWEYSYENHRAESLERLQILLDYFPPLDLANTLIDIYFHHSNLAFPLLHRPTFNRQWNQQLHHRNIWFAGVCLSMFAIASRWSNDNRVLPAMISQGNADADWKYAGRQYFDMVAEIHRIRESPLHPTNLFEVQTFTLMGLYLQSAVDFPAAWIIISTGLRKTQDVGAHRKKVYREEPNLDDELWKRAFWMLVILDRVGGINLGRPCCISEEDFDLDFPLEVDDEFYSQDPKGFKQPAGIPSALTAFVQAIKLTQIMAFSVRTLYAINKSKVYHGVAPVDQKLITNQLSLAMAEWLEHLPEHLRWKNKMENPIFFAQSTGLFTLYHMTQMLIWRPLIGTSASPPLQDGNNIIQIVETRATIPALTDPAINKCIEAARACARIVEVQLQHGISSFYIPGIINVSYVCAGLFLLNAWNLKIREKELWQRGIPDMKPTLTHRIEQDISEAKIFLHALENVRDRWDVVDILLDELNESLIGLNDPQTKYGTHKPPAIRKSQSTSFIRNSGSNTQNDYSDRQYEHTTIHLASSTSQDFYHPTSSYNQTNTPHATYPNTDSNHTNASQKTPMIPLKDHSAPYASSNTSWDERSVPYISSVRTTLSTERLQDQHSVMEKAKNTASNTQSLSTHVVPARTDDTNTSSDDREHRTNQGFRGRMTIARGSGEPRMEHMNNPFL